jgi:hypothetical protein
MNHANSLRLPSFWTQTKRTVVFLLVLCILTISGCGGTKVYTIDKTIVYRDEIYNLANVQKIGSRSEGRLPNGDDVNMRTMDKKGINALLDEHSSVIVSNVVELDSQEMIYQRSRISKYSEYSSMQRRFDGALSDISKFMGDKKKTQLKLK